MTVIMDIGVRMPCIKLLSINVITHTQ